jgi:hypothetical protein
MASLHQALVDLAPEKAEAFEEWFPPGDRRARLALPPILGALAYLRKDPSLYFKVSERAGRYASQWGYLQRPWLERRFLTALPLWVRGMAVGYLLRRVLRLIDTEGRLRVERPPDAFVVLLQHSLFCRGYQERGGEPRCSFFAALFGHLLDRAALARPPMRETACLGQGHPFCRFETGKT